MLKKTFAISFMFVFLVTMVFVGCKATPAEKEEITIGYIYLILEHPYYQAHSRHAENYCKELGINLIGLDGKADAEVMAEQIENLVTQKVDGIVFCLIDSAAAVPCINEVQENGIPIITFAIRHGEGAKCPFVGVDEYSASFDGGAAAANWVLENKPDWEPKLALVTMPSAEQTVTRAEGFKAGYLSVTPDAEVVAEVDGGGVREKSMNIVEDLIQSNPDFNVIYGINGDSILGAMAALEAAGRGTTDTELAVGHDGTEPEIIYMVDSKSSLKVDIANQPGVLARMTIDVLLEVINGERDMYSTEEELISATVLEPDIGILQKFLEEQYFSELNLKEYVK